MLLKLIAHRRMHLAVQCALGFCNDWCSYTIVCKLFALPVVENLFRYGASNGDRDDLVGPSS